jgi:hypothetical protein
MSQLQAAPAIGKAPPNPIFSADALKPLLQIGYQTPSSQLSFPERRLSAAGFAHSLSEPELTKKYNSKFLNLCSCSRPLTLSTFHAEHYCRPGCGARRPRERHVAATRLTVLAGHTAFATMEVPFLSPNR